MNPSHTAFVFTSKASNLPSTVDGVSVVIISMESRFRSLEEYRKENTITESEDSMNLFVDIDRYNNMVEFRVMNPHAPANSIFAKTDDVHRTIDAFSKNKLPPSYDILAGQNTADLPSRDREQVQVYMASLMYRMLKYMSAGYHKYENIAKIDDWCVCFYDPIMLYFITYFGIHSQSEDISIVDEFLTNAQFRHMITIELMKVSAHHAVNNDLLDVSTVGSWIDYDYNNWVRIYEKIN